MSANQSEVFLRALAIATDAHRVQKYRDEPYIYHPIRVSGRLADKAPELVVLALLHDTVEDGKVSLDLIRLEFGDDIANALDALTRRKAQGETYPDYIRRVKTNAPARIVKIADLEENLERCESLPAKDPARSLIKRYRNALDFLKND